MLLMELVSIPICRPTRLTGSDHYLNNPTRFGHPLDEAFNQFSFKHKNLPCKLLNTIYNLLNTMTFQSLSKSRSI